MAHVQNETAETLLHVVSNSAATKPSSDRAAALPWLSVWPRLFLAAPRYHCDAEGGFLQAPALSQVDGAAILARMVCVLALAGVMLGAFPMTERLILSIVFLAFWIVLSAMITRSFAGRRETYIAALRVEAQQRLAALEADDPLHLGDRQLDKALAGIDGRGRARLSRLSLAFGWIAAIGLIVMLHLVGFTAFTPWPVWLLALAIGSGLHHAAESIAPNGDGAADLLAVFGIPKTLAPNN